MNNDMEHVVCDLCGADDYVKITSQTDILHGSTTDSFDIVQCKKCELCYTNPRPTKDNIYKYYVDDYSFHRNKNKNKMQIISLLTKIASSRFGWLINVLPIGRKKISLIYPDDIFLTCDELAEAIVSQTSNMFQGNLRMKY